jgi:hypothetical protein
MPSCESSLRDLEKARAKWRPPRPWRSTPEAQMIRQFVFQWFTCRDHNRHISDFHWTADNETLGLLRTHSDSDVVLLRQTASPH